MDWLIYLIGIIGFLALIYLSLRERAQQKTRNYLQDLPEIKLSPFSQALANLVGTAGGIYLSLVMITTFLELPVPDKIIFLDVPIEPLAAISLLLAILQPFLLKIYYKLKYRF